MKRMTANICIWILGKLGYSNQYSQKDIIKIEVDATDAIKQLKLLSKQVEDLKNIL